MRYVAYFQTLEQADVLLIGAVFALMPGTAKHWRIRHGSFDRDTSLAIPVILATMLENKGYEVDFHLPWGLPHSGDYDLPQLFAWMEEICHREES